jgi:hypothetical protein
MSKSAKAANAMASGRLPIKAAAALVAAALTTRKNVTG